MAKTLNGRLAADIEGDFVVFLIGMRINKFWKVHKWLPVFTAMPKMLKELSAQPEAGVLGYRQHLGIRNSMIVQNWRSFDDIRAYAQSKEGEHFPAWAKFNRSVGTNGDVGIWHETFYVASGQYEAIYGNMPAYGLGKVSDLVPATGRHATAAGRMGRSQGDDAPIDVMGNVVGDS